MEQFEPNNSEKIEQSHGTDKLTEQQLSTVILEIKRADQILLSGIDFEMGEFQRIKEHLVEISDSLFRTILDKAKNEEDLPKDRLECLENLNRLEVILGRQVFDVLLKDSLTNRETLGELERKLSNEKSWWKKIFN